MSSPEHAGFFRKEPYRNTAIPGPRERQTTAKEMKEENKEEEYATCILLFRPPAPKQSSLKPAIVRPTLHIEALGPKPVVDSTLSTL